MSASYSFIARERGCLRHHRWSLRGSRLSPRVENEQNSMLTILFLVEAEEGVAIVPASTSNLRSDGVQFVRLIPDDLYLDLIAALAGRRALDGAAHISRFSGQQC